MDWATLERVLTSEGEVLAREELGDHLEALLAASSGPAQDASGGGAANIRSKLREAEMRSYDANAFSQIILGFENVSMN